MLYDPKWNAPKTEVNLESLIAWLEKQPADATYDSTDAEKCLISQWMRSIDSHSRCCYAGDSFEYYVNGAAHNLRWAKDIVFYTGGGYGIRKFGGALKAAKDMESQKYFWVPVTVTHVS